MKHSKRFFALLTAGAMTMSMLCITSFAANESTNEPVNIMTDDFESYYSTAASTSDLTVPDANGEGRFILKDTETTYSQNWYAASKFGNGADATTGILPNPDDENDQVLAIEADAAYYNRTVRPRVVYTGMNENGADKYTYKFDFYKGSENVGGGILFNYTGIYNFTDSGYATNNTTTTLDTSNLEMIDYYMLNFVGKNNYAYGYNTSNDAELYSTVIVKNNKFQETADITTTPDEETGLGDYVGTNAYGSTTNTFTTTGHDYLPAQTWFSVELSFYKGTINWTVKDRESDTVVQTGSWTDSTPICVPAGFAFHAAGVDGGYMYFDNVSIEKEEMPSIEDGICTYAETFSYTADDGAVGNATAAVRANKNDYTIVESDAGSWKLSDAYSGHGFPGAYISAGNKALTLHGHQVDSVNGEYTNRVDTARKQELHYPAVVNFEPATTGSVQLQEFMIQAAKSGYSRYGIRIAISEDEQSYYEIGCGDRWDYIDGYDPIGVVETATYDIGTTGIPGYAPYVIKCVDGVRELLNYNNTYGTNTSSRLWTVTVDGSQITVNARLGDTSANTFSYSHTFTDTDGLLEKSAYPVAVYSSSCALFDNISMKYTLLGDAFTDNDDGTATVSVVPARYLKTGDSLNVVTAFYDENGGFISASETAMSTAGSHNVETPANYSYAKVMMYDGSSLVKEISTREETVAISGDKTVIACIGDSNTGNTGVTTEDTWSTKIGALLGEDYDVQNYGKGGSHLMSSEADDGILSYTETDEYTASLTSNPDIVIIMLGTNDGDISDTTKRATFKSEYIDLIETYQNLETQPEVIITVPPIRKTGDAPNYAPDTIRPVIQEISEEKGLRYVDMSKLVTDYNLLHDELHFVDEGYFQFAEHFYNAVRKNVTSSVSDDKQSVVINSDASFSSDIAVAVYKDGILTGVEFVKDASVLSAIDYPVNVSALDIENGDNVKVMIIDDQISPYTYVQTIANKEAYVSNTESLITGNTTPNARVGVTVYNGENLVYADTANADRSGYYKFVPELDSGTYTVITTAGMNATLTVE